MRIFNYIDVSYFFWYVKYSYQNKNCFGFHVITYVHNANNVKNEIITTLKVRIKKGEKYNN